MYVLWNKRWPLCAHFGIKFLLLDGLIVPHYIICIAIDVQTSEKVKQARKILENVQSLERQKQNLQFQQQQLNLSLQQVKATHAMEQVFQKAMKIQEIEPDVRSKPIKLVLRKRSVNNYNTLILLLGGDISPH